MPDAALVQIRKSLLGQGCPALRPEDGYRAFQEHKLLATAIHRAAHLDRRKAESETDAWVRYLTEFFPTGRNSDTDARSLFGDWRTSLLKQDTPGPGVLVT